MKFSDVPEYDDDGRRLTRVEKAEWFARVRMESFLLETRAKEQEQRERIAKPARDARERRAGQPLKLRVIKNKTYTARPGRRFP
jgi:hypothetical protein